MAEEHMYIEYRDGKPHAYRYGEEWVAMELLLEGGYPTEREAREAWERYKEARANDTCN